jgi:type VI secretion system protein VasJ
MHSVFAICQSRQECAAALSLSFRSVEKEHFMNFENLGRSPIPGPSPAGQDIRYDAEYSRLQEEIDKLNSVTQAGSVDWNRVVTLGAEILETRSKDIMVAVYMFVGLMQTLGIEGMITGVGVINDLVTTQQFPEAS